MHAALGGAHSLVLAEKKSHPGLVNPWGVQRAIYSFGYGFNGLFKYLTIARETE